MHAEYKKNNPDLIQKMNRHEREKVVPEEHERDVIRTHERMRGEADCKYLDTLTCAAIWRCQEAKKRVILAAEKKGSSQHQQMSQAQHVESCCKDKHRSSHHQTPPAEKTLTKTMPQGAVPTPPVKLHCNRTTSEQESTGPEPAEEEQVVEVETSSEQVVEVKTSSEQVVEVKTSSPPAKSRLEQCTVPFTVQPFAYTSCTSRLRASQGSHRMGDQWHQL